jgi:RimJ/RimL family protein N-acetyltransferase
MRPTSSTTRRQECDVVLRDGSTVHVRPVLATDAPRVHAFFEGLSVESLRLRFFGLPSLDWATRWAVDVDYADRYALVATAGPLHAIIAHGAYLRIDRQHAEVAFVVADAWQGHGIATIMLSRLAVVAEDHGISAFVAEVLPYNERMLAVFRDSGFPVKLRTRSAVTDCELELPPARARLRPRQDAADVPTLPAVAVAVAVAR